MAAKTGRPCPQQRSDRWELLFWWQKPERTSRQSCLSGTIIQIVPLHIPFGNMSRDDGVFPSEDICAYYERTKELPKTSGSMPEDFTMAFDQIHTHWPDAQVLYLTYFSVTICSYQSAQVVAEGRNYMTSMDTKAVSTGLCSIVLRMARLLEAHPAHLA